MAGSCAVNENPCEEFGRDEEEGDFSVVVAHKIITLPLPERKDDIGSPLTRTFLHHPRLVDDQQPVDHVVPTSLEFGGDVADLWESLFFWRLRKTFATSCVLIASVQ